MKLLVSSFVLAMALTPVPSSAATNCQGVYDNHVLTVAQSNKDVEVTLENDKLIKYESLRHSKEGVLKLAGKNVSYVRVLDSNVDEFLSKKALRNQLVRALIAGRDDYDGDQDIWGSIASSMLASLKCK